MRCRPRLNYSKVSLQSKFVPELTIDSTFENVKLARDIVRTYGWNALLFAARTYTSGRNLYVYIYIYICRGKKYDIYVVYLYVYLYIYECIHVYTL